MIHAVGINEEGKIMVDCDMPLSESELYFVKSFGFLLSKDWSYYTLLDFIALVKSHYWGDARVEALIEELSKD